MKIGRVCCEGKCFYAAFEQGKAVRLTGSIAEGFKKTDEAYPLSGVKMLAPAEPSKVVCVGKNYLDHAKELAQVGTDVPEDPLLLASSYC